MGMLGVNKKEQKGNLKILKLERRTWNRQPASPLSH
jgi:hypothetical protein